MQHTMIGHFLESLLESIKGLAPAGSRATSESSTRLKPAPHTDTPCDDEKRLWTSAMNQRRCQLVDKEIDDTISEEERTELDGLQSELVAYRQKVAPLPLDDLRKLHQDLLEKATRAEAD
jgi:hypothetical protein